MTIFADREHAIEAHYAARELAAFMERSNRFLALGSQIAEALNLHDAAARLFAARLSELCVIEPSDDEVYRLIAKQVAGRGLMLSDAEVRQIALSGNQGRPNAVNILPAISWIEFVTNELLALFGAGRAIASTMVKPPHVELIH